MRKSALRLYAPFIGLAIVQALFIALLPSTGPNQGLAAGRLGSGSASAGVAGSTGQVDTGAGTASGVAGAAGLSTGSGVAGSTGAGGSGGAAASPTAILAEAAKGDVTHCKDGKQYEMFVGYHDEPPCTPKWPGGDNGGATYQGVTATTIKIVIFDSQPNAAVDAVLAPQGLSETTQQRDSMNAAGEAFVQKHYELYGRKIEWTHVVGDCPTTPPDYDKCLAAAREVIKMKPFMVLWATPLYATVFDEWAKAGIVSIGGWHFDQTYFNDRRPYRYDAFMDGTRSAELIAEYYCKKLAGKPADHAGAETFPGTAQTIRSTRRRLGISVPEIEANVSTAKHVSDLIQQCDPGGQAPVIVTYVSDIERAQEQSDATTQKFISSKVTTTVCMCDPIAPAFGTAGYTKAGYFPEILMPGLGLLDYDKLGRLYDKQQMRHAFGPSHLRDEVPFAQSDADIVWHDTGNSGDACPACNLNWAYIAMAGSFIEGAGPILNPLSIEKYVLNSKPQGGWEASGHNPHVILSKFGPGDYTAVSDAREVYWDETAISKIDGNPGAYVSLDGGHRYENGTWPAGLSPAIPVRP